MKKHSVLIPTANRPKYLETALKSVARQTVADEIEEVIVSENGECRDSEAVCAKFPNLPIRYIFRDPQIDSIKHFQSLYLAAKAPLVSLLCDDDWWGTTHLYMAGRALDDCQSASSWFSEFMYITSEMERHDIHIWRPMAIWAAAGYPDVTQQWRLNFEQIVTMCWIVTPFHFSAMVARREAIQKAISFMDEAQPYYADRILYPGLALEGDILFEPFSDTYARWHSSNWLKDKKQEELLLAQREGSNKIRVIAQENGYDPAIIWHSILTSLPRALTAEIKAAFQYAVEESQLRSLGFSRFVPPKLSPIPIRASRRALRIVRRLAKELPKRILIHK